MRLTDEYLSKRLGHDCGVVDVHQIGGGYTDKVYMYTLATENTPVQIVVRHEALGAFDRKRSLALHFRLLRAMHAGGLPVPKPLFYDARPTAGGPLFCVEFVIGDVVMPWGKSRRELIASLSSEELRDNFVRVLCDIHRVRAPDDLSDAPGRREHLIEEVAAQAATLPAPDDGHVVRNALDVLRRWSPDDYGVVIFHGDYHLGNLVLSESRSIVAVIDWEYAGVGDPLYDVGWILAPHFLSAAGGVSGLMSEAQFVRRYERFSGIEFRPADVAYWRILQQLRVHAMFADATVHRSARTETERARFAQIESALPRQREDLRILVDDFSRFFP